MEWSPLLNTRNFVIIFPIIILCIVFLIYKQFHFICDVFVLLLDTNLSLEDTSKLKNYVNIIFTLHGMLRCCMCCLLSSYFFSLSVFFKVKRIKPTALRHNHYNWSQTFHMRVMNSHNVQTTFGKCINSSITFFTLYLNHCLHTFPLFMPLSNAVIDCFVVCTKKISRALLFLIFGMKNDQNVWRRHL